MWQCVEVLPANMEVFPMSARFALGHKWRTVACTARHSIELRRALDQLKRDQLTALTREYSCGKY